MGTTTPGERGEGRAAPRGAGRPSFGLSPAVITALCAVGVAGVAALDYFTGPGLSVTLLYLGPIGICSFYAGIGPGIGLALVATVAGVETARLAGEDLSGPVLVWNAAQQLGVFLMLAVVLDAFQKRLLQEQAAARTDALTGLSNRRAFVEAAWLELERGRRHGRPLSLLYIDCDDFKGVNDRLGHVAGDAVLAAVGQALRQAVRGMDTVARLGGDEFGVLLPEVDAAGAAALADRLRAQLRDALDGQETAVTFSVGVATFLVPPASVDEMILRADELMYEAKRSGKDRWRGGSWGTP